MRYICVAVALIAIGASGCGAKMSDIGKAPELTGVRRIQTVERASAPSPLRAAVSGADGSAWVDSAATLFRDARAMRVGDVITVKISIRDRAVLDNTSNRSRESKSALDASFDYDAAVGSAAGTGSASGRVGAGSKTSSTGKGGVLRSENIELLVAALVEEVLPNGNLLISGTQELRVNFELRELTVAGVVRPRDVSTDNTISYDRIAEARISYGGRGRITEVQQPAWGQQIVDVLSPF